MSIAETVIIALALSMDAFAVSVAGGMTIHRLHIRHAVKIAAWFGLFQALMPLLGWTLGMSLGSFVSDLGKWIAAAVLWVIGAKMIWESYQIREIERANAILKVRNLFVLSVATCIDAMAVGLSLAMLRVYLLMTLVIIGGVTFVVCLIGVWLGDKGKHFFEQKIEAAAGVMLILIGTKTAAGL